MSSDVHHIPETSLFGGKISAHASSTNIPTIITKCIKEIDKRGILSQGIYRLSGQTAEILKLKQSFTFSPLFEIDPTNDINAITGVLKCRFSFFNT